MTSAKKAVDNQPPDEQLAESLMAVAGASNTAVEEEISVFLEGKGTLLETAETALTRAGTSAADQVAGVLQKKFGLSPVIARVIAALVINLLPRIKRKKTTKKKPKTPRSSAKPAAKKKAKKKNTAKEKKSTGAKAKKNPAAKKPGVKKT